MNIVVFSGGTATNSLTPCFQDLCHTVPNELTYILPISDNGGSTSEILRVLGGPAIGDIRSRVVRLVTDIHVQRVFSYRLPDNPKLAKAEWNDLVEGHHSIWHNVPTEVKEIIRSFIIHVQAELLKKNRSSHSSFQFAKASVGNLFLTGARLFLGSLDASIELMMRLGRCEPNVFVLPCINSSHTHHISALLTNGEVITGQAQISHPSTITTSSAPASGNKFIHFLPEEEQEEEFANPVYILPELKASQLHFHKEEVPSNSSSSTTLSPETKQTIPLLPAPIKRILYINPYGEEIKPMASPRVISKIKNADMIVYSIGSLMTSLLPTVILGNVVDTIVNSAINAQKQKKVLLINNSYDRETYGLDGYNYVKFLVESMYNALSQYTRIKGKNLPDAKIWNYFITDIVYLTKSEIFIDEQNFTKHKIVCHSIDASKMENKPLMDVLNKIHNNS